MARARLAVAFLSRPPLAQAATTVFLWCFLYVIPICNKAPKQLIEWLSKWNSKMMEDLIY
jgi:hypothetical protein